MGSTKIISGVLLPYSNYRSISIDIGNITVYLLETWGEEHEEPDFEIDDPSRNLVAIDDSGTVRWIVESVAERTDGSVHHEDLYEVDGRLISKTSTGRFYELDPEQGTVIDSWAPDQWKVAGEVIELDGPVEDLQFYDGVYVVKLQDQRLYGIDRSGALLWERNDGDTTWLLERDEEGFRLVTAENRGRGTFWYDYELDVETGEVRNVDDEPEKFLGEVVQRDA